LLDDGHVEALVRRTLDGDSRAFGEIVAEYQKVLFNVALRMTNDREDAADLTQTAFLRAYRNLRTWDSHHRFFSWIYRILVNATLDHLARRRPQEELDEGLPSADASPEDESHERQLAGRVQAALMELTPEKRQVIVLRHFLHRSHRDISEAIGVPEKTVKSRLHDARQALGAILQRRGVHR
jgi:RNA polymerase sigma-70 factor, ECF subfamily